jgi:hypothetical protein
MMAALEYAAIKIQAMKWRGAIHPETRWNPRGFEQKDGIEP